MNIIYHQIIIVISCIALIVIKPVVRFYMRDRYKFYKDVCGNDVKVKTYGYMKND